MGRLIDADRLKSIHEINKANFNTITGIREWIDSQPTAYDVEKVVEQLQEREKTSKECYVEAMTEGISCSVYRFCGEKFAYNDAIEIVRKGGAE